MTVVAEGLELKSIYWYLGGVPKHLLGKVAVDSPSTSGWGMAFILPGEKHSTIFDPFSFQAWTVPNNCDELRGARAVPEWRPVFWTALLKRNWEQFQRCNLGPDLDTAAIVFKRLGIEVPHRVATVLGFESKVRGGKEVAKALARPIKKAGKRGLFLAYILEKGGAVPVRELMAHFGITRSNALSYLFLLQKDHGIGYALTGDLASVSLPEGVVDPFAPEKDAA